VKRRLRDWLIGSAILVVLVVWVQREVGWATLLAPWRDLPAVQLAVMAGLSVLSYLCRGIRLAVYFPEIVRGRLGAILRLSVLHNVANNLLPMRAGEAVFPLLMKRHFGHGYLDSALSLLWIRLLDLHVLLLVGVAAAWLALPHAAWWFAAVAWLAGLPLVHALRGRLLGWCRAREHRLASWLLRLLQAMPADGRRLAGVYFWTLATWGSKIAAFTTILLHFLAAAPWQALLGVLAAELSSVLPFHGVAGTGSYEVAMVAALLPTGIAAETALAGAVNLHLFLLGVTLLLGLAALLSPRPAPPPDQ
jgi:uncharacterized membrane protein YbhN (UPF0104 family)